MQAIYQPPSGFRDHEIPAKEVTILSFVETTFAPGYMARGEKRGLVAVIADERGRLTTAELPHLTLKR